MAASAIILAACLHVDAQSSRPEVCDPKLEQYEQVLDAYFSHARGDSSSAVVLRVYGGLASEYEIVIDPDISTHAVFEYAPEKSIWGNVYDGLYTGKHETLADYTARAIKLPLVTKQFEVPEATLLDLMAKAKAVNVSICEHLPLRKGHLIEDANWFEVILDGGGKRARVTDTSDFKKIVSQNPALLRWALDVQMVARPVH